MKFSSIVGSDGKPAQYQGKPIDPNSVPHRVRQVGTTAPLAFCSEVKEAEDDAADKNTRAQEMGIRARYEVFA